MNKPSTLTQLLDELKDAAVESSVISLTGSHALVFIDDDTLRLNQEEAELLFHSVATVEQFYAALGDPSDAALELHDLTLEENVISALERLFVAVDEG